MNNTMKAAVLYEQNKPLVIEEILLPSLEFGQVLVKLAASGVCHKQIEDVTGKQGPDPWLPHLLGHEGSGIVESIGDGVTLVSPGDHVILSWLTGPGINAAPPKYFLNEKRINAGPITTFNDYAIISENKITKITKEISLLEAALIGCVIPTGVGAAINESKVEIGSTVAVFGVGGVGLNIIQGAALVSPSKIIAIDILDNKLSAAKDFGATDLINAKNEDPVQKIKDLTDGKGVDFVFESAGLKVTMEQAYESASNSGVINLVGNPAQNEKVEIDALDLHYGKKLIGGHGGNANPSIDFTRYINLSLSGKLDLKSFTKDIYELKNINRAIDDLKNGIVLRPLITFEKGK